MTDVPDENTHPNADSQPQKRWTKHLPLFAGIIAAGIAAVALAYILIPTPTPAEAAEQYIEDHYDAIAQDITHTILPDSPLKAELAAEIVESLTEQLVPYSCVQVAEQALDANPVNVLCTVAARIESHIKLNIAAPFDFTVDPDLNSFRANPQVQSATINVANTTVNDISLSDDEKIRDLLHPSNLPDQVNLPNIQGLPNPIGK